MLGFIPQVSLLLGQEFVQGFVSVFQFLNPVDDLPLRTCLQSVDEFAVLLSQQVVLSLQSLELVF